MRDYLTISSSSLSTFYKCSQQYKWQYIDELQPEDKSASLHTIFGSVFHKCLELHFKYGIEIPELIGSWRSLFISTCTETKNLEFPRNKELQTFINKGYDYFQNVVPMIERWSGFNVMGIEQYFKIPYVNKFLQNVFITGRIDLLLNKINEIIVCLDWKTSKNKEKDIDNNVQLTFYTYFVKEIYKYNIESIHGALAYPFDKDVIFTQRINQQMVEMFEKIDIMLERISKNDFKKEPKIKFLVDDCFFCPYKKLCCDH